MNSLSFCDFSPSQEETVYELLGQTFETSPTELKYFYQKLQDDFTYGGWPLPIYAERRFFSSLDQRFQPTYEQAPIVACDLPSLLSRGGQKLVMIVAQDALSNEPTLDKVRLGTPYAMHLKQCREEIHNTRRYFQMIDVLLRHGYQVYLTDLYKIYVGGVSLKRKDRKRFRTILEQEVEQLKPAAAITWGRPARIAVEKLRRNLTTELSHYDYPHPAAPWAWARRMGIKATHENVLAYWQKALSEQLDF